MITLKKFEFKDASDRSTYDWAKLLDGKIYQLTEGEDYTCKTVTFQSLIRNQAKKAGKAVKSGRVEGGLVVQAVPLPEGEENTEAATEEAAA